MERQHKKKTAKRTWFKNGGHESFLMVSSTKGSELKKNIEEKLRKMNLNKKVKIIEKPGQKFIDVLKANNRKNQIENCTDPDCLMTKSGGNCKTNEVVYCIKCKSCGDKYIGETSRNGHSRCIEHVKDSQSRHAKTQEDSIILRHINEKHDGKEVPFEMKTISSYLHDPLSRQ